MDENRKSQSPIAWVLGQTGDHGGQYVLSVILAVIGVAFSVAPYFVVVGIVQGLMEGRQDFSFYLTRCLIMAALWLGRFCSTLFLRRPATWQPLPYWARSVRDVRKSWPACRWVLS